jgi:hypothetical protein
MIKNNFFGIELFVVYHHCNFSKSIIWVKNNPPIPSPTTIPIFRY